MKKKTYFHLIVVSITLLVCCKQNNSLKMNSESAEPLQSTIDTITLQEEIHFVKEFYINYFSILENSNKNTEEYLDELRRNYMSVELYQKFNELELDYDPIINGQDINPNWKQNLQIQYLEDENHYKVSIGNRSDECVFLKVLNTSKGYKIVDIKVNDMESILNNKISESTNEIRIYEFKQQNNTSESDYKIVYNPEIETIAIYLKNEMITENRNIFYDDKGCIIEMS